MSTPIVPLARELNNRGVRYVLSGVARVTGRDDLFLDLTLVMKGFDFEAVWKERREFMIDGVPVPTARLLHIVESKQATGREKDQLFLATHLDALQQLLKNPDSQ